MRKLLPLSMAAGAILSLPLVATAAGESSGVIGSGKASYYGNEFAGKRTANGEKFQPGGLTAAHRTLPFHSRIRVTNLGNSQSVVVRINDRGPWTGGRIIDLSYGAAKAIGLHRTGTGRVKLERVD